MSSVLVVFILQTGIVSNSSISNGGLSDTLSFNRKGNNLSLKTTLREMMIFLVSESHRRYARAPSSYPTSPHLFDFGESFEGCSVFRRG